MPGLWSWIKHSFVAPSADANAAIFATQSAPAPSPAELTGDALHAARFAAVAQGIKEGKYRNIVVLTGAGVSTAAGIPDFRSKAGLYELSRVFPQLPHSMAVFDAKYFKKDPVPFYFIVDKIMKKSAPKMEDEAAESSSPRDLAAYEPTLTHSFLRLLDEKGVLLRVYTQNVDCMELAAGLPKNRLVQFHGTMADAACSVCKKQASLRGVKQALVAASGTFDFSIPKCPRCASRGNPNATVKPNIVLFNEGIPYGAIASAAVDFPRADLLLCIGSTFQVFPFAGLAAKVDDCVPRVLLNMEKVASGGPSADAFGSTAKLFRFNDDDNSRDVFVGGACDRSIETLADRVGWGDRLRSLFAQPARPAMRPSSAAPAACGDAGDGPGRWVLNIDTLIAMQEGHTCV